MQNQEKKTFVNPVISGFYPDPSVVRVGEDYYLATSSFEYFPGVPIFHSRDLVNWKQIGSVLTRKEQLNLEKTPSSSGIFAPTIRYHNGTFYMITTDVRGIGNFFVTAKDPAGPWSDPIKVPYGGIDPSLFFDDDGKVYVTVQQGWGKESHIIQYEINPETGEALNEPRRIWDGDGGVWTEAPHLYKINGMYYIMSACGGTSYDHREIIGRSKDPYGPFEPCPYPILTHKDMPEHPLQCLGHADLVDDVNGNWWAVFLGTRPVNGKGGYTVLGRETFLAPVTWNEDGWPMIDNNEGIVMELMTTDRLPVPSDSPTHHDEANYSIPFPAEWSFLRTYDDERYKIEGNGESFTLIGNEHNFDDDGDATFACLRQTSRNMRFSAALRFEAGSNDEEAGIAARLNHRGFVTLTLARKDGDSIIRAAVRNGEEKTEKELSWNGDSAYLEIRSDEHAYYVRCSEDGQSWQDIPLEIKAEWLTQERNGGFTGVVVGLYASGNGQEKTNPAFFNDVQYENI